MSARNMRRGRRIPTEAKSATSPTWIPTRERCAEAQHHAEVPANSRVQNAVQPTRQEKQAGCNRTISHKDDANGVRLTTNRPWRRRRRNGRRRRRPSIVHGARRRRGRRCCRRCQGGRPDAAAAAAHATAVPNRHGGARRPGLGKRVLRGDAAANALASGKRRCCGAVGRAKRWRGDGDEMAVTDDGDAASMIHHLARPDRRRLRGCVGQYCRRRGQRAALSSTDS